jgi:hypothetical protein
MERGAKERREVGTLMRESTRARHVIGEARGGPQSFASWETEFIQKVQSRKSEDETTKEMETDEIWL